MKSNRCHIYVANDNALRATGFSYALALRHELGHCNGWPANHPGNKKYVHDAEMPTLPASTRELPPLPTYPPLVCLTPDWKAEPCTERKPDLPVRTWAEIYRYLYRTTWLRAAVYKRPVIDESVWELQVAKTINRKKLCPSVRKGICNARHFHQRAH
jgi:hypothetical protein